MTDESLNDTTDLTPNQAASIVDTILDLDEFLSGDVRRARKSARICVRPDLEERLDELDAELETLIDRNGNPLSTPATEALAAPGRTAFVVAQERRDVEVQMHGAMRKIVFEQMPEDEWTPWYRVNKKKLEDEDSATFDELIVRCAVEPKIPADKIAALRGRIGFPQIKELADVAWLVNTKSGVDVPKSPASSHVLRLRQLAPS